MSSTTALFGCTGLVGKNILATLLESSAPGTVHTVSRRAPLSTPNPKLNAIVEADNSKWTSHLESVLKPGSNATVMSALGTTRSQAGGLAGQWKIDHDLNVEIARTAKAAGASTFVFVSSAGTRGFGASHLPYSKMKVGVEDTVKDLGFDQAIILRPGGIIGQREGGDAGQAMAGHAVDFLGKISGGLRDAFGQDAFVIARAAVAADRLAREGKAPSKFWVLESKDILKLGRDEWKTEASAAQPAPVAA